MKRTQFALSTVVPVMALSAVLCFMNESAWAQRDSSRATATQQAGMHPVNQDMAALEIFSGKIVKAGNKFVLTDAYNKTSYQLDDQQKAQGFLNKNVKVNGVLDPSTGTIRVTAIEPA
jgi:Protein of unknown function (DUF5818)